MTRRIFLLMEGLMAVGLLVMATGFARAQSDSAVIQQDVREAVVRNTEQLIAVRDRITSLEVDARRTEAKFEAMIAAVDSKLDYALFGIAISLLGHMLAGVANWKRGKP